jgi:protein-arginine kinase activator protein McsA
MEGTKGFLKSSPDKSEPVVKCSIHDLPLTQILNEGDKAKYLCEMCSTSEEYRDKDVQSLKPMAKDLMNSLTKPIEDFKLSLKELNDQHPEKFKSQVIADGNRYFD